MNEGEKTGFSNGRVFSFLISKRGRRYLLFAVAVAALANVFFLSSNTNALKFNGWSAQHILNQAFAQGVHRCYTNNSVNKTIQEAKEGHNFSYRDIWLGSLSIYLPNGLAYSPHDDCASVMNDNAGYTNTVQERLGVSHDKVAVTSSSNRSTINSFMTGMGYSSIDGEKTCYAIKYRADRLSIGSTADAFNGKWDEVTEVVKSEGNSSVKVCIVLGSDGKIKSVANEGWNGPLDGGHGNEYILAYVDGTVVHFELWAVLDTTPYGYDDCTSYGSCVDAIFDDSDDNWDGSFDAKGLTKSEFEKKFKAVTKIRYTQGIGAGSSKKYDTRAIAPLCHQDGWLSSTCDDSFSFQGEGIGIYVSDVTKTGTVAWELSGDGNTALKYISDNSTLTSDTDKKKKAGSSWGKAGITAEEKAILYQWYMANPDIGRTNIKCDPTEEELKTHPDWTHTVEWFDDKDTKRTCYVASFPNDGSVQVALVDKDGYFDRLGDILELMEEMNYGFNVLTNVDPNDIIPSNEAAAAFEEFTLPSGTPKEDCFSGAGSMGWLICPIIFDLGKLVQDRYAAWVEPALQIDTLLFGNNDGSPAYAAWNVFRTIANLAFVIVFLIIIFSQLTGVGVDNYGIKKILPKLIVGAILINLSYIVCQLAIDIANIIGYGIAGLFQWISSQINSGIPPQIKVEGAMVNPGKEGLLGDGVAGMGAIVVLIVGVLTTASVLSQGTALVIPVLMAVLGVSFSFFALIAILGIRQAAAVLLVVASPLAFVCYMLPNTKKIFDKWFKALQGLLIAFPACSALVYGGDMVGRILLSTSYGSTWILISAAVVSVAPIFFIPKLIRGSMGAVSNTIANVSSGLGRKARDAGNNSRLAKDIRASHDWAQQRRINLRRAGLDENYQETERGRRRRERAKKGSYAQINMARARAAVLRDYSESAEANRVAGEEGIALLNNKRYGVDEKLNNADIAAAESQLKFGQMTMTGIDKNGKEVQTPIDPNSIDQLKQALVEAIIKGEDTKQKALVNALTKRGDDGREAVHGAIEESERAAQQMNSEEIRKLRSTHKSLASHIMDNFASTYKNNNRSTYDWAARNQTESQAFNNEFLGGKREWMANNSLAGRHMSVNNVKGTSLLNMDNQEFKRLADSHSSMSDTEKEDLTRAITVALHSNAASTADLKRIEDLQNLMKNLGKS